MIMKDRDAVICVSLPMMPLGALPRALMPTIAPVVRRIGAAI
jgi:hypothetical protein